MAHAETLQGSWWKESDLLADCEQRAREEQEKRQQAHQNRVEAGRARVVHDRWTDDQGQEQALTSHPSYDAVVKVFDSCAGWMADGGLDAICKEWRDAAGWHCDLCSVVYEVAAVIGPQPAKYWYLETVESSDEYGPDTVLWWPRTWVTTRAASYELHRRARAGDPAAVAEVAHQALTSEEVSVKRRKLAFEQRLAAGVEPCQCTRAYECPEHELAYRVGEPGNPFGVPEDAAWFLEFGS